MCEGCAQAASTDWSHRIARSRGGLWVASNGLHLCRDCHRFCHHEPDEARDLRGWVVRTGFDTASEPVLLALWGWVLLDDEGMIRPSQKPC